MKYVSRLCLFFLLIIPATLFAQDLSKLTFEKFTSKDGKFTVLFPGKPHENKQKKTTEIGDTLVTTNFVAIGNDLAFFVFFNDYSDIVKNSNPGPMLEGARNGIMAKDGELVEDETIKFGPDKLPARRFLIKKPGGIYVKNMVILKGARLYQVMVLGKKELVESKEAEKFCKSFDITK
ncbi:MAG TPA: hypothetical protein PLN21_11870 [Gemmatales bacterium]|nr:hypothetical protein [Gemmatales bacterium]